MYVEKNNQISLPNLSVTICLSTKGATKTKCVKCQSTHWSSCTCIIFIITSPQREKKKARLRKYLIASLNFGE